ncbi:MAG TPA: 30S ribosomal protein S20 [Planctomycetota bacterium]|nr:30S ribosomal protein S20 [Planctomycetota bacterium]
MPNSKQAKKRQRQNEERRDLNKVVRTSMRSAIKKVLRATDSQSGAAELRAAMKRIDKAAKKRVIHPNAAARYKSRLAKRVAALAS